MSTLVSQWLSTNYPQSALPDATRFKLLNILGPSYSIYALPELWGFYFDSLLIPAGPLQERFAAWYVSASVPLELRNPFWAVAALP